MDAHNSHPRVEDHRQQVKQACHVTVERISARIQQARAREDVIDQELIS